MFGGCCFECFSSVCLFGRFTAETQRAPRVGCFMCVLFIFWGVRSFEASPFPPRVVSSWYQKGLPETDGKELKGRIPALKYPVGMILSQGMGKVPLEYSHKTGGEGTPILSKKDGPKHCVRFRQAEAPLLSASSPGLTGIEAGAVGVFDHGGSWRGLEIGRRDVVLVGFVRVSSVSERIPIPSAR